MKPVSVLELITTPADYNGLTRFPLRLARAMDSSAVHADFLTYYVADERIRAEIEAFGGELFVAPSRLRHPVRYLRFVSKLVREKRYPIVHVHGNSCTMAIDLLAAKLGGAPVRIAHSHNSTCKFKLLHRLLRPPFDALYTDAYACGKEAGRWLFGEEPFQVIPNAVETERFAFSLADRSAVRDELSLGDGLVLGHVGNFVPAKNPLFLLEILQNVPDAKLLMVGDGPMRSEFEQKARELGLSDRIVCTGARGDVARLYSAMDALLLPSLFEGFPTVALEAQCAGLPVLLSGYITPDCALTTDVSLLPLDASAWSEQIRRLHPLDRSETSQTGRSAIAIAGYDLQSLAAGVQADYLKKGR